MSNLCVCFMDSSALDGAIGDRRLSSSGAGGRLNEGRWLSVNASGVIFELGMFYPLLRSFSHAKKAQSILASRFLAERLFTQHVFRPLDYIWGVGM